MKAGLTLALLAATAAVAQTPPPTAPSPWTGYGNFGPASVNLSSLDVHLDLPIYSRPTVGNAQIGVVLSYDSQFWQESGGRWTPASGNGWQLVSKASAAPVDLYEYLSNPPGHRFGWASDCPTPNNSPVTYAVPDGKGYSISVDSSGNAHAYDRLGDRIDGGFWDQNGNAVTFNGTSFTDPLGTALTLSGSASPGGSITYSYTGPNGGPTDITEDFASYSVSTDFFCSGMSQYDGSLTLPSDLKLPDGSEYVFGYAADGRLASLRLPTGATVDFSYSTPDCSDLGNDALGLWNSIDGSSEVWSWTRSMAAGYPVTTQTSPATRTEPSGDATVYTLGTNLTTAYAPTQVVYYQGTTSGTELESIGYANTTSGGTITQQVVTREVSNPNSYSQETDTFDVYGNQTGQTNTDWGASPSGLPILRKVTTEFANIGYGWHPYNVTISGGTNTFAETAYGYDLNGM